MATFIFAYTDDDVDRTLQSTVATVQFNTSNVVVPEGAVFSAKDNLRAWICGNKHATLFTSLNGYGINTCT
jgi:hypothetical protein